MEFENNEALAQEDTTPGAEASSETNETNESDAASQESGEETNGSDEGGQAAAASQAEEPEGDDGIDIRFNHQDIRLSREDAIKYSQMGMKLEKLDPLLSKVEFLASVSGKTREEYIEELMNQYESGIERNLRESFTGDEKILADLIALEKGKHKEAYENMLSRNKTAEEEAEKQAKEGAETRIAGEYAELIKEFPELEGKEFGQLPANVKKAAYNGTPLMTAYLLHQHTENKKVLTAAKDAEKQNKASVGSMSGGASDNNSAISAMMKGLWG